MASIISLALGIFCVFIIGSDFLSADYISEML